MHKGSSTPLKNKVEKMPTSLAWLIKVIKFPIESCAFHRLRIAGDACSHYQIIWSKYAGFDRNLVKKYSQCCLWYFYTNSKVKDLTIQSFFLLSKWWVLKSGDVDFVRWEVEIIREEDNWRHSAPTLIKSFWIFNNHSKYKGIIDEVQNADLCADYIKAGHLYCSLFPLTWSKGYKY